MYVNAKMMSVKIVPVIRGEGINERDGEGKFKYDILATL
jgi:hypothetical protein